MSSIDSNISSTSLLLVLLSSSIFLIFETSLYKLLDISEFLILIIFKISNKLLTIFFKVRLIF